MSHESGRHPIGCTHFDAGDGVYGHGVCRQLPPLLLVGGPRVLPAYLRLLRKSGDSGLDGTAVLPGRARLMGAGEEKRTQHCIQWQPAWLNCEKAAANWQREQFNAKLRRRASSLWRGPGRGVGALLQSCSSRPGSKERLWGMDGLCHIASCQPLLANLLLSKNMLCWFLSCD